MSVNKANYKQLIKIPGIGPVTAKRIIEHRKKHGSIQRFSDLEKIKGIGSSRRGAIENYYSSRNTGQSTTTTKYIYSVCSNAPQNVTRQSTSKTNYISSDCSNAPQKVTDQSTSKTNYTSSVCSNAPQKVTDQSTTKTKYTSSVCSNTPQKVIETYFPTPTTPETKQTNPYFPELDLNLATPEQLDKIPGFSMALVEEIVKFRNKNGRFESYDDMRVVLVIQDKAIELLQKNTYLKESKQNSSSGDSCSNKLDLNLATIEQLSELPEISVSLAEKIVNHRNEIGPFKSYDQLQEFLNIDETTIEIIKSHGYLEAFREEGKAEEDKEETSKETSSSIADYILCILLALMFLLIFIGSLIQSLKFYI